MRLIDIAHARAGDKGNIVTLALIAYRYEDYPLLEQNLTPDRFAKHFDDILEGRVIRYELAQLGVLFFVLFCLWFFCVLCLFVFCSVSNPSQAINR